MAIIRKKLTHRNIDFKCDKKEYKKETSFSHIDSYVY